MIDTEALQRRRAALTSRGGMTEAAMARRTQGEVADPRGEARIAQFDAVLDSWREAFPGFDVTSVSVSVSVSRLAGVINRAVDGLVRPYGFGYGELEVLFYLLAAGKPYDRRPSDLVKGCFVTSGAITGRVDRLEKLGLVTRIPSLIDRREMMVRLTRDGEKLTRRLRVVTALESPLATALRALPDDKRAAFDETLRALLLDVEDLIDRSRPASQATRGSAA